MSNMGARSDYGCLLVVVGYMYTVFFTGKPVHQPKMKPSI